MKEIVRAEGSEVGKWSLMVRVVRSVWGPVGVSWKLVLGPKMLVAAAVAAAVMQKTGEVSGAVFLRVVVVSVLAVVNLRRVYLNCFPLGKSVSVAMEMRTKILGIGVGYKAPSPIPETVIETVIPDNY